jgi:hypothetical protein
LTTKIQRSQALRQAASTGSSPASTTHRRTQTSPSVASPPALRTSPHRDLPGRRNDLLDKTLQSKSPSRRQSSRLSPLAPPHFAGTRGVSAPTASTQPSQAQPPAFADTLSDANYHNQIAKDHAAYAAGVSPLFRS